MNAWWILLFLVGLFGGALALLCIVASCKFFKDYMDQWEQDTWR